MPGTVTKWAEVVARDPSFDVAPIESKNSWRDADGLLDRIVARLGMPPTDTRLWVTNYEGIHGKGWRVCYASRAEDVAAHIAYERRMFTEFPGEDITSLHQHTADSAGCELDP